MQAVVHRAKRVSSRSGAIPSAGLLACLLVTVFALSGFAEANASDGGEALLQVVPGAQRVIGNKLTESSAARDAGQARRAHRNAKSPMDATPAAGLSGEAAVAPNRRKTSRGDTRTTLTAAVPAKPSVNRISRKRSRHRTTR